MLDSIVKFVTGIVRLRGGTDGTTIGNVGDKLKVDASVTVTSVSELVRSTYGAGDRGIVPAASPTDIYTLTGSATKTIRVSKLSISATKSTAGVVDIQLIKRSTANSGGTSSVQSIVPYDSQNNAATAVSRAYTGNPTAGTTVGNFGTLKLHASATSGNPPIYTFAFGDFNQQELVLRGANEVLSVNLNGITVSGGSFAIHVEWTEE